jgi:hypothetical protein
MTYLVAVSLDSLRTSLGVQGFAHGEDPGFADRVIKDLVDSNRLRVIHTDDPELVERVARAIYAGWSPDWKPESTFEGFKAVWRAKASAGIEATFDA